jgi:hypothetical protein
MRTRFLAFVSSAALSAAVAAWAGPASAAPGITPGAFCAKADAGQVAYSSDGDAYACMSDGQRYRWRPIGGGGTSGTSGDGTAGDGTTGDGTSSDGGTTGDGGTMGDGDMGTGVITSPPSAGPVLARPPARCTSKIAFDGGPEPLKAGSPVVLSGRAGCGAAGNAAPVRLYFRKYNGTVYTLIAATRATPSGAFRLQTKQTTSGYWKAVYAGNAVRTPVQSGVDYVEARAWRYVKV